MPKMLTYVVRHQNFRKCDNGSKARKLAQATPKTLSAISVRKKIRNKIMNEGEVRIFIEIIFDFIKEISRTEKP